MPPEYNQGHVFLIEVLCLLIKFTSMLRVAMAAQVVCRFVVKRMCLKAGLMVAMAVQAEM